MKLLKSIICVFLLLCILGIVYAYLNVDQVIEFRTKNARALKTIIDEKLIEHYE